MSTYDTPSAVTIPVLPVVDLARALAWYGRLGFATMAEHDQYAILSFSGAEVHLAAHESEPAPEASSSGAYLRVADADAVHAGWSAVGARIIAEPVDQPYGIREFATEDLDGNLWRVGSPIAATGTGPGHGSNDIDTTTPPTDTEADPGEAHPDEGDPNRRTDAATVPLATDANGEIPTDGSAGTGDGSWATVAAADVPCAGCELKASEGPISAVRAEILFEADRWDRLVSESDDDVLRMRPEDRAWSSLEYAFHVKGVLGVMTERIALTLAEANPDLGWWDQDAAVDDGMANELDRGLVVDDLRRNAQNLADVLARVDGDAWERTATRRGEVFSVASMARYAWHEVVHHRVDAEETLADVSG